MSLPSKVMALVEVLLETDDNIWNQRTCSEDKYLEKYGSTNIRFS